jgi:hypothetical protein
MREGEEGGLGLSIKRFGGGEGVTGKGSRGRLLHFQRSGLAIYEFINAK